MIEKITEVYNRSQIKFETKKEWEHWVLVGADLHLDNPHTDRKLIKHHLEQAKDRQATTIYIGDIFDAMQGKSDRRASKSDLMQMHKESNYLNRLVEDAYDFLSPYRDNLSLISEGNHETAITKHMEYSLLDGLCYLLRKDGSTVVRAGYRGYIRFQFEHPAGGRRQSYLLYYHHGAGGGGPVTKGVIQTNRKAVYLPDVDIVVQGHIHEKWIFPITRARITKGGTEFLDYQYHIQIPTYKDEFTNLSGGYHHEGGRPPKPVGAYWLRFYYSTRSEKVEMQILEADR